ncbi:alpha/beta fold family hydrolase [Pseudohyphozyma bogoriensis]|nr:alpha/beta fold family hydrolase [Pseudohyphozyma bogoriensis]
MLSGHIAHPGPGKARTHWAMPNGAIDAARSTIVVLSPTMHDHSFLQPVFDALSAFNVVCIDLRGHGKTISESTPAYDFAVAAADVVFTMNALEISAAHFYAPGTSCYLTCIKIVTLFPSSVLTLTFAGTCTLFGEHTAVETFREIDQFTGDPQDGEEFTEGVMGLLYLSIPGWERTNPVKFDKMGSILARIYTPRNLLGAYQHTGPMRMPHGLTHAEVGAIKVPILWIHGEADMAHSPAALAETLAAFTGTKLDLHILPGAPHTVDLVCQDEVIRLLVPFLSQHSQLSPSQEPLAYSTTTALKTIARLTSSPSALHRDPTEPESYTFMSHEQEEISAGHIRYMTAKSEAFNMHLPACEIGYRFSRQGDV